MGWQKHQQILAAVQAQVCRHGSAFRVGLSAQSTADRDLHLNQVGGELPLDRGRLSGGLSLDGGLPASSTRSPEACARALEFFAPVPFSRQVPLELTIYAEGQEPQRVTLTFDVERMVTAEETKTELRETAQPWR